jgi:hypothetical protein
LKESERNSQSIIFDFLGSLHLNVGKFMLKVKQNSKVLKKHLNINELSTHFRSSEKWLLMECENDFFLINILNSHYELNKHNKAYKVGDDY